MEWLKSEQYIGQTKMAVEGITAKEHLEIRVLRNAL